MVPPLNYATYLRIDELLDLQQPRSEPAEHDEHLFITFHQICELWFQQLLHEFDKVKVDMADGRTDAATVTFTRVRRILKTLVAQMDVLETLTPLSFNAFRDRLDTASGFQSMQFREIEFVLGMKREGALDHHPADLPGVTAARRRLDEPSIADCLYRLVARYSSAVPQDLLDKPPTEPTEPNAAFQAILLELYKSNGELRVLFELMTDIDEILQEWRYRHVKVVERTIGNKPGTGGSPGVEYLRTTIFLQAFPDLWAIRHDL